MKRNLKLERKIARERVDILFKLAQDNFSRNRERAHSYARLAWRIALRYNLGLPREWKPHFCRGCKSFLMPGENSRVRVSRGRVVITCLECGRKRRIPVDKHEKSKKRAPLHQSQRVDRKGGLGEGSRRDKTAAQEERTD